MMVLWLVEIEPLREGIVDWDTACGELILSLCATVLTKIAPLQSCHKRQLAPGTKQKHA